MLSRYRSTGSIGDESEKQEGEEHEWMKNLHREGVPLGSVMFSTSTYSRTCRREERRLEDMVGSILEELL
jgi:hypothetical protein